MSDFNRLYSRCHELFEYCDGHLYRKIGQGGQLIGAKAGGRSSNGYINVRIDGTLYMTHRIIYLMHFGVLPKYIDHINQNKLDSRIENLRESTCSQNLGNVGRRSDNTSGCPGVQWNAINNNWRVILTYEGKRHEVGSFKELKDAIVARNLKHRELYGEFSPTTKEEAA
jgi:hypothetical protein